MAQRHPLHDRLTNVSMRQTREAAVRVVDAVQVLLPEEQIAGSAAFFLLLCDELGYEPREALQVAANVLTGAKGRNETHFRGLRDYLRHYLRKQLAEFDSLLFKGPQRRSLL
jgi:hypothetical protein